GVGGGAELKGRTGSGGGPGCCGRGRFDLGRLVGGGRGRAGAHGGRLGSRSSSRGHARFLAGLKDLVAVFAPHRLVEPVRRDPQDVLAMRTFRLNDLIHEAQPPGWPRTVARNLPPGTSLPWAFGRYSTSISSGKIAKCGGKK